MQSYSTMQLVVWFILQFLPVDSVTPIRVVISPGHVENTAPNKLELEFQITGSSPTTITFDFGTALFVDATTPTVVVNDFAAGGTAASWTGVATVSNAGRRLVLTRTGGTLSANLVYILETSSNLVASLPSDAQYSYDVFTNTEVSTGAITFPTITAPQFSLSTANMIAGTQPTQLTVLSRTTLAVTGTNSEIFFCTANKAIFVASQTSGVTPTGISFASQSTTNALTFQAPLATANVAANTPFTLTFASSILAALPNNAGAVTMTCGITYTAPYAGNGPYNFFGSASGFGTIVAPSPPGSPASVSGDPITWFGNRKAEFDLPFNELTMLLRMPDLEIFAAPFLGSRKEQWIGRVVVKSTETGANLIQVDVHQDLSSFDREAFAHQGQFELETMSVLVGSNFTWGNNQFTRPGGPSGIFSKIGCEYKRHQPCREGVMLVGQTAKLLIASSSAREFYGEVPDAYSHVHLDFDVFDATDGMESFEGPLPEMWGLKPISEETRKLLTKGDPIDFVVDGTLAPNSTAAFQAGHVRSLQSDPLIQPVVVLEEGGTGQLPNCSMS
eukprot:TRINITY_DN27323_c0_g1_i1.p1 TRINITY_DN27323_c0_g1~~TRINITY_DN27323_c0_g1_i1.p1  ORF type:complete len:559 (-),score=60.77 TRINITY_DN27323_c0_g1_i1:42-1718(-)